MPARVELDGVDAVAEPVMGHQQRLVALRPPAVRQRFGRAGGHARLAHAVERPAGALALERLAQRGVEREQVDVLERDGLVEDGVRRSQRLGGHPPSMGQPGLIFR